MNKPLHLIWEGPDLVGKTTTRKLVEKRRKGKDIVIDRFLGSNIVYGHVFDRYTKEEFDRLYLDEYKFSKLFNPILIYLWAPVKEIRKRAKETRHEKISKKNLEKTLDMFNKYFDEITEYKNKIKIDTSKFNQEEVVNQIINYLNYVENK